MKEIPYGLETHKELLAQFPRLDNYVRSPGLLNSHALSCARMVDLPPPAVSVMKRLWPSTASGAALKGSPRGHDRYHDIYSPLSLSQ